MSKALNTIKGSELETIEVAEGEVFEPKFYHFRQNNSGGSFDYDAASGVSVNVYIEAASAEDANERAASIGIYFDDFYDCDCCGSRWSEVTEYDAVTEIPEKGEVMVKDDNDDMAGMVTKWLPNGQSETFVHTMFNGFYGTHDKLKHIKRRTTGYGLSFTEHSCGDIIAVGKDGWNKSGNFSAPAPGEKYPPRDQKFILKTDDLRVVVLDGWGGKVYRVWGRNKADVEAVRGNMKAYLDTIPKMDIKAIISINEN